MSLREGVGTRIRRIQKAQIEAPRTAQVIVGALPEDTVTCPSSYLALFSPADGVVARAPPQYPWSNREVPRIERQRIIRPLPDFEEAEAVALVSLHEMLYPVRLCIGRMGYVSPVGVHHDSQQSENNHEGWTHTGRQERTCHCDGQECGDRTCKS